jgi:HK97 gp10 family phage protein
MARRSRLSGDFKLRKTLRRIHQTMDNELRPAMEESSKQILESMRDLVPKDTGASAAALQAYVSKDGLNAEIGLRGKRNNRKFYYLRFIEYGTKGYTGGKRSDSRNRRDEVKTDGSHWFGKHPDIPARPAHPWLRPAYQVNREVVLANIHAAVGQTLKKAAENA